MKMYIAPFVSRRRFIKRTAGFVLGAGGLFIPKGIKAATGTAYMTNSSGTMAQSILNKVEVKRKFLTLNGSFSLLRIAIRCQINGSSLPAGTTSFFLGAQTGTSTGVFSSFATNCLIADQIGGSWSFLGSGTTARYSPLSYHATIIRNPSFSDSSAWATLGMITAKSNSGSPCMVMTELIPGSPNWTVKSFMPAQNGTPSPVNHATMLSVMGMATPTLTGYAYMTSPAATFAFDQIPGNIDTATYGWTQTVPIEVVDFAVAYAP